MVSKYKSLWNLLTLKILSFCIITFTFHFIYSRTTSWLSIMVLKKHLPRSQGPPRVFSWQIVPFLLAYVFSHPETC
jgi:hypothetical protein